MNITADEEIDQTVKKAIEFKNKAKFRDDVRNSEELLEKHRR